MPTKAWIQAKTEDDIEEKQRENKTDEDVAKRNKKRQSR